MQSALLSTQQLMGGISQSYRDTLRLPSQVWKAWSNAVQHSQLLRTAAKELLQRRMRNCLSECLRSWAAHAHDMQEARSAATAHGDTVARCIRRTQMQMSLTVSFWLRPRYAAYALAHTAAVLPLLAFHDDEGRCKCAFWARPQRRVSGFCFLQRMRRNNAG